MRLPGRWPTSSSLEPRARKHAAVAGWIEQKAGERREELAEILAHHYATAFDLATAAGNDEPAEGLREPAIEYLTAAGERALPLDIPAAERHYSRALALVGDESDATPRLLSGWASVLFSTDPRQAAKVWRDVIERLKASGERRRAALAMHRLYDVLEALDEPRSELSQSALDLLAEDGPSPELVEALAHDAGSRFLTSGLADEEFKAALDRAIAMSAELGLPESARLLEFLGLARCNLGDPRTLDDHKRALEAARAQGLGEILMEIQYNYAAVTLQMLGTRAGLDVCGQGLELAHRRGDARSVHAFRMLSVVLQWWNGDWERGLSEARELEAELLAAGESRRLCRLRTFEALMLAARGELDEAALFLEWLVERGRASEAFGIAGSALLSAATVYAGLGQVETAFRLLAAVADRGASTWSDDIPSAVRTALAGGDVDLAARLVTASTQHSPLGEHALVTCRALVAETRGECEAALAGFADAVARWRDFGAPYEEAQALLGEGRCLVALGRAAEVAAPLAAAREIFTRLGAEPALAETEQLSKSLGADAG